MRRMFRAVPALLLALMLPFAALAERASAWSLRFEMGAVPEDKALAALGSILECLTVEATLTSDGDSFDLSLAVTADGHPASRTELRLYGTEDRWVLTSPLLGEERLLLRNESMTEYFNKLQEHLGLPLGRLSLLHPYCTRSALARPSAILREVMQPGEVSPEDLADACRQIALLAETGAFGNWLKALGGETGTEEVLISCLESLPDYLAARAPDGLTVVESELGTVWQITGDPDAPPLFAMNREGTEWTLSLPGSWSPPASESDWDDEGWGEEEDWDEDDWEEDGDWDEPESGGNGGDFFCQLSAAPEGGTSFILRAGTDGSDLDIELSTSEGWRLRVSGSCLARETVLRCDQDGPAPVIRSEALGDNIWDIALLRDGADWLLTDMGTGLAMLRIRLTAMEAGQPGLQVPDSLEGTDFYSLNDATMNELIRRAAKPAILGASHLVAALPAGAVADLLDWLEEINLLTEDTAAFD